MSERDTLIPSASSELRFEGAPPWALAVVDEMRQARAELSTAMGEFSGAAQAMTGELRGIRVNQDALKTSFELFRDESRATSRSFEDELKHVRQRVAELEDLRRSLIPGGDLAVTLSELRQRIGELELRLDGAKPASVDG